MTARRTTPLTRDEIFSAALTIIDAEGLDALSMRRLARDLGVEAMSLYHHVPNKSAVLDGVVDLALRADAPPAAPAPGAPWQETVAAAVLGFRRALVAHPNVLPHMIAHPPASEEASAMYIAGPLRFLLAQGFAENDASDLFEAVFALSFGHALLTTNYPAIEPAAGLPNVEFTEASFERAVQALLAGYGDQSA
jgi:TetR/AcrR family transcriptional regulator, tetracycline repressor protein